MQYNHSREACDSICNNASLVAQAFQSLAIDASRVVYEQLRPFILLRPKIYPDGNKWCCLYGDNLQEGVAAFGDTPDIASRQFDIEWLNQKLPAVKG